MHRVELIGLENYFLKPGNAAEVAFDLFLEDPEWVVIDEISSDINEVGGKRMTPPLESQVDGGCSDVSGVEILRQHGMGPDRSNDNLIEDSSHWFLNSPQFRSWVNGNFPVLWVRGLPGSGKSVIATNVIAALDLIDCGICVSFFCNQKEASKQLASSIIQTIIYQVAQKDPNVSKSLTKNRKEGFAVLHSPGVLWRRMVVDQINPISRQVYVVIDGLDECDEQDRAILLDIITSNEESKKVSWLVFSRFSPDIARSLHGPNMIVRPFDSMQDIRQYTEKLVDRSPLLCSIRTELVERISRAAGGMFLWVKFVIQLLEKEESVLSVRDCLHSLPSGMDNMYDRIVSNLTADNTTVVSKIFEWIACAERPLGLLELSEAIGLSGKQSASDFEFSLLKHCGPLISVSTSNFVGFVHRTLEEYLTSNRCVPSFAVKYQRAHTEASNACLLYLSKAAFATRLSSSRIQPIDMTMLSEQYPFLAYSTLFWPRHINLARGELNTDTMKLLSDFIVSTNLLTVIEVALTLDGIASLQRWMQALSSLGKGLRKTSRYENIQRFIFDFQQLLWRYGHVLAKCPSDIHSLIDEDFPSNSHFWKYFGRPLISFANCQREEWHPLIATLKQRCITSSAINTKNLAAADKDGVSIWDLQTFAKISRISGLPSSAVALAFKENSLAILCQDGTLRIVSTMSWMTKSTPQTVLTLPALVKEWNGVGFWSANLLKFDAVHVNLGFVGKGILASNWLVNLETGEKQPVAQSSLSSSTISHLACTKGRDLVTFTTGWQIASRTLGSPESPLKPFEHQKPSQKVKRLLAISATGRFAVVCAVTILNGYSQSANEFECLCSNLDTTPLRERFSIGDRISAAVFSDDESMLAVSSHNGETLADTTRVWVLEDKPRLVWEAVVYDDYTTALFFGLDATVLIKAGRLLRIWDISKRTRQLTSHPQILIEKVQQIISPTIENILLPNSNRSATSTERPLANAFHRNFISDTAIKIWKRCVHWLDPPRSRTPRYRRGSKF